jgi:hypothetical protein
VYEGVITKLDPKRGRATVRFVGYGNEDTVSVDQLLASKGEEWREGQQWEADRPEEQLAAEESELRGLLEGDCQELLLLSQLDHSMDQLVVGEKLEQAEADTGAERAKNRRKEKSKEVRTTSKKSSEEKGKKSSGSSQQPGSGGPAEEWASRWGQEPHPAFAGPPLPPLPPLSRIPLPPLVPPLPSLSGSVPAFLPPPPVLSSEDLDFIDHNTEVRGVVYTGGSPKILRRIRIQRDFLMQTQCCSRPWLLQTR